MKNLCFAFFAMSMGMPAIAQSPTLTLARVQSYKSCENNIRDLEAERLKKAFEAMANSPYLKTLQETSQKVEKQRSVEGKLAATEEAMEKEKLVEKAEAMEKGASNAGQEVVQKLEAQSKGCGFSSYAELKAFRKRLSAAFWQVHNERVKKQMASQTDQVKAQRNEIAARLDEQVKSGEITPAERDEMLQGYDASAQMGAKMAQSGLFSAGGSSTVTPPLSAAEIQAVTSAYPAH